MLPGSIVALGILVALIPGFCFLRWTEDVRKPTEQTPLQEAAEIVAVGLVTTGAVILLGLSFATNRVFTTYEAPLSSPSNAREAMWLSAGLVAAAVALAWLLARAKRWSAGPKRYAPNVWQSVFGKEKPGHARHIIFELTDGRTFDGPIRAYTVSPAADGSRQLAIWGEIRVRHLGQSTPTRIPFDFMVVDSGSIAFAAMTHVPEKPKAGRPSAPS